MSGRRNQRVARRETRRQPWLSMPWKTIALIIVAMLGAVAAGGMLLRVLDRPVTIEVAGTGQRVSALEVQAALAGFEGQGFVSVDLAAARAAAESLAWVDRARIQRAFPARLRVTVTEQVAAARWGDSGLLNTRGELFVLTSRHPLPELPVLDGPDGTEWRVAQRFLEAHGLLMPLGFTVRLLHMDPRGAWDLELDGSVRIRLGREDTERRLRRLAEVVSPLLQDLAARVAYVDMRYDNGFVIGWKPGQVPDTPNNDLQG